MPVPRIAKLDLASEQRIADIMREAQAKVASSNKHIATLLGLAADTIEASCDALKWQENLIGLLADMCDAHEAAKGNDHG